MFEAVPCLFEAFLIVFAAVLICLKGFLIFLKRFLISFEAVPYFVWSGSFILFEAFLFLLETIPNLF